MKKTAMAIILLALVFLVACTAPVVEENLEPQENQEPAPEVETASLDEGLDELLEEDEDLNVGDVI